MKSEEPQIRKALENIISTECNDGFNFVFESIKPLSQPHMNYPGYRTSIHTTFGKMRDKIQVDIGVGDIVEPKTQELKLFEYKGKSFFEGEISLQVYPVETIFAEKLETVLSKGAVNSRMKDYHDLFLLAQEKELFDRNNLRQAIKNTFENRNKIFESIKFNEEEKATLQVLWNAHYQGLGKIAKDLNLPEQIEDAISIINSFLE